MAADTCISPCERLTSLNVHLPSCWSNTNDHAISATSAHRHVGSLRSAAETTESSSDALHLLVCMCMWVCAGACACVRVHAYVQAHVCMHSCVHECVRACMHVCFRACVRACIHMCARACVRACFHRVHMRACTHKGVHARACMPARRAHVFVRGCVRAFKRACACACVHACILSL